MPRKPRPPVLVDFYIEGLSKLGHVKPEDVTFTDDFTSEVRTLAPQVVETMTKYTKHLENEATLRRKHRDEFIAKAIATKERELKLAEIVLKRTLDKTPPKPFKRRV